MPVNTLLGDALLLGAVNWHSVLFFLFAAIACAFCAGVLFSSNVVRMAFYLVISLAATAGLFFLSGAEFLGAMQIMIYVGGTLVLLIFGVMLTAQEAFISMKTRAGEWVLSLIVGAAFLLLLVNAAFNVTAWNRPREEADQLAAATIHRSTVQMGFALTAGRVDHDQPGEAALRQRGMSGYLLAFEAVGIHLLIVLVGAAYLSRTKRFLGGRARPLMTFETRERRRWGLISAVLVLGMVLNLVLAVATFAGRESFLEEFPEWVVAPPAEWVFPVLSLLFLLNVLLLAVVWGWQRWGLVLLWVVPLVQGLVMAFTGFEPLLAVGVAVALLVPVALLTALVCWGPRSAWSQMD